MMKTRVEFRFLGFSLPVLQGLCGGWVMALLAVSVSVGAEAADKTAPVTAEIGTDGIQRATLILDSYTFDPAHLVVQAGKPVELTLKNVSTLAPHNFKIDDIAGALYVSQEVKAGRAGAVRFTPTKPGTYAFFCDKKLAFFPSHRTKGMEGVLEVRP